MTNNNRNRLYKRLHLYEDGIIELNEVNMTIIEHCIGMLDFKEIESSREVIDNINSFIKRMEENGRNFSILIRKIQTIYSFSKGRKNRSKLRYHLDDFSRMFKKYKDKFNKSMVEYNAVAVKVDNILRNIEE